MRKFLANNILLMVMVLDQLSSIMGAELLGKEVVPDFIDNQQVGMVVNFTQHFVNQTNHTVHNHTKHLTGLYTHDGHKVQVQKDRSDEEDDVSSFSFFPFRF